MRTMSKAEYRAAIDDWHLSQGAAADALGISIRMSNAYANGDEIPRHLAALIRLARHFNINPTDLKEWMYE